MNYKRLPAELIATHVCLQFSYNKLLTLTHTWYRPLYNHCIFRNGRFSFFPSIVKLLEEKYQEVPFKGMCSHCELSHCSLCDHGSDQAKKHS